MTRSGKAIMAMDDLQAVLLPLHKLGTIGQLSASVAHEINNALAGILGNVQLLLMEREAGDPEIEALRRIEQSAKRCKEVTHQLLRFAREPKDAASQPFDLNSLVRDALALTEGEAKVEGISVVSHLSEGSLMVMGNASHLAQVILALISRARAAMLTTEVKQIELTTRQDAAAVLVQVADTGDCVPEEDLQRIFRPFLASTNGWSPAGLGLWVAGRVISEHQGEIHVATELGRGSTFLIRLPRLGQAMADRSSK